MDFAITLEKSPEQNSLGVDVDFSDGKRIRITQIGTGLIAQWNAKHPHQQVLVDDAIISVNNVSRNAAKMMEEAKRATNLQIILRRKEEEALAVAKDGKGKDSKGQ